MPKRLLTVVVPVCALGLVTVFAAAVSFVLEPHDLTTLLGVTALLAASTVANRFPVPVEGVDSGGVSLSFVFGARALVRIAYNACSFALAAAVAAPFVALIGGSSTGAVVGAVAVSASLQYAVNLALMSAVVSRSTRRPFFGLMRSSLRWTIVVFALMASAAVMLVVLWQRSPLLSAVLVGPLLAIALYQRSTYHALRAMRLALTDPLTGLGNHRHFHDRLQRELVEADAGGTAFTLCLLDVDDFKRINDLFGHPEGDRLLAELASNLRQNGEAFRLGGDEFALLLPGHS